MSRTVLIHPLVSPLERLPKPVPMDRGGVSVFSCLTRYVAQRRLDYGRVRSNSTLAFFPNQDPHVQRIFSDPPVTIYAPHIVRMRSERRVRRLAPNVLSKHAPYRHRGARSGYTNQEEKAPAAALLCHLRGLPMDGCAEFTHFSHKKQVPQPPPGGKLRRYAYFVHHHLTTSPRPSPKRRRERTNPHSQMPPYLVATHQTLNLQTSQTRTAPRSHPESAPRLSSPPAAFHASP